MHDDELFDRIHGAWLGRVAGCALEVDFEGTINGDLLEGVYYPDTMFGGKVRGKRVSKE